LIYNKKGAGEMKRFFIRWEGWCFLAKKPPKITYCAIPKEVWITDLKKAADCSGQLSRKSI
jgi:hypothetical protein